MRRKEKEIEDRARIEKIVSKATVCRLAMIDDGEPYVVPMNFGYSDNAFYFHSAREGRKIDALRKNPRVCFELDVDLVVLEGEKACEWGARYESVIGWGTAVFVEETEAKRRGLDVLMAHYAKGADEEFSYPDFKLERTAVIRVDVERMVGKKS